MSDLISRQDAVNAIVEITTTMSVCSSVDECHGMKRMQGMAVRAIEALPSAEPERKIGHWVEIGDEPYDEWECDMCGFVIDGSGCIDPLEYLKIYNFCPNCGASMSEGEENEKA